MPSSTTGGYGTYNPSGIDPFQIESVLAKIVGENNPAAASNMLDLYQISNTASASNYNAALNQQHDFAKQQLQQQLQEQYLKSSMDAIQHPGGLAVMNAVAPGSLTNLDPNVANRIEGGLTSLQNATTLEKAGAGAYSAAQAGRDVTDAQAAAASGGLLGPAGTPLSTRNELIKEAGANARAAASAGREREPSWTFQPFGNIPGVGTISGIQGGGKTGIHTLDDAQRFGRERGLIPPTIGDGSMPGVAPTGGGTGGQLPPGVQPKAQAGGRTNLLPMAPRDPGKSGTLAGPQGQVQPLQPSTPGASKIADGVRLGVQNGVGSPEDRARIQAGMATNGGQPKLGMVNGKVAVLDDKNRVVAVAP